MNNIVKILMFAIVMATFSVSVNAQSGKQRMSREQLAEVQAKHIAHAIALEDDVTPKFVEAYCQYQKSIWALGPRAKNGEAGASSSQSVEQRLESGQKRLDIRKQFYAEIEEFLTPKQVERVYEEEHKIMKRMTMRANQKNQKNRK